MPTLGTETFSEGLSLHAGGGAFITAAAFCALGWEAALLATLPADPFDKIVLKDVTEFGVDSTHCAPSENGAAPQVTVAISGEEDRAFLSHKTGQALPDITMSKGRFRHLHIGELRSLVEHPNLIAKARQADMSISVDCSWDNELLHQGAQLADLLSQVDVFLPNQTEYELLTTSGLPQSESALTVVKCGRDGARAFVQGQWLSVPALQANIVDSTGAGDAFNGGFLSSWLMGRPMETCLASGNSCGRSSIEEVGGTGGLRGMRGAVAKEKSSVSL